MSKASKAAKSVFMIMVFTLLSKVLGFFREMLIASKFGAGYSTDTYFVAMTATTILMSMLGSALNTTLIPVFVNIEEKQGKTEKLKYMNNVINILFFITLVLMAAGWFLSPCIIKILAKGFQGEQFQLAVKLNRIGLPIVLFMGTTYVFSGFLQSSESFAAPAAIGLPFNAVYIIFLLFFSYKFGLEGLMVAAVLATLGQVLIQIPSARRLGYRYSFEFNWKDKNLRKALFLAGPVLLGSTVDSINTIVDKTMASSLADGSISALNYAAIVNSIVISIFIVAITTVIFPMLSREFSKDDMDSLKRIMGQGIRIILLVTLPAVVCVLVLSEPIIKVLFQRGAFDSRATDMTSQALLFYSIGMVALALRHMLNKVFYSLQDTKTPMINGIITVGLNIIFNIIFIRYMAHAGLALATSLSFVITTTILFYSLRKKIGSFGFKKQLSYLIKAAFVSLVMGVGIYLMNKFLSIRNTGNFLKEFFNLCVTIGFGAIIYIAGCYFMRFREVAIFFKKENIRKIIK